MIERRVFLISDADRGGTPLGLRMERLLPRVGVPFPPIGDVRLPIPTSTRSYHLRPLFNPPLISKRILSSSIVTLVIWIKSPLRPAGPISLAASSHCCLSKVPSALTESGFF